MNPDVTENPHSLALRSCPNARELGGYHTPFGPTLTGRFVRCGSTRSILPRDMDALRAYGVARVVDLRSRGESPHLTCGLRLQRWVTWTNVPLFDYDISAGGILSHYVDRRDNYLVTSYLSMLDNHDAIRAVFLAFAQATPAECVLFHCAAGMDRTGVVAMLLLGLAEVDKSHLVADYAYSFADEDVVDALADDLAWTHDAMRHSRSELYLLAVRMDAISRVYDTLLAEYGSVRDYLEESGVPTDTVSAVLAHLVA